jgi:hypothetical protein
MRRRRSRGEKDEIGKGVQDKGRREREKEIEKEERRMR